MIDKKHAKDAFLDYVSQYDMENNMIRLKVDHTLRVAANCERIAESLAMNREYVNYNFPNR